MTGSSGGTKRLIKRVGCAILLMPCGIVTLFLILISPLPLPDTAPSGPVRLPADFQKGLTLESWWHSDYGSAKADATLTQVIRPTGATWIALIVKCGQTTTTSTTITCDTNKATPTDADLAHMIQKAHSLGLRVMLKPHVDMADQMVGRDKINFGSDEQAWQRWFAQYTTFITHYAAVAEQFSVAYFVIGTELSGTVHREQEWRKLIQAVRKIYSGPLTYAALSYTDEYRLAWWDALDTIGIDAYYPLTLANRPNLTKLKLGWIPAAALLEAQANRWHKPIIFTEVGYMSVVGVNRMAGIWANDSPLDLEEQANCYRAVFEVFQDKAWWHGVFWWSLSVDPNQGGPTDRSYTPHGKPAEDVLKLYFKGAATATR